MRFGPLFVVLFLVGVFLLGWQNPNEPEEPPSVRRGGLGQDTLVLRPGESAAAAVRFLRTLRSDPPPPAPPPPDVSVVFKQALRGVERNPATGSLAALVSDPAAPGPQIQSIVVGDRFGDGWRIEEITESAVTLRKGRETRVVRLYG